MELIKYLLIPFAFACINVVQAETHFPTKQVNLPFNNEALFSQNHSRLVFNYDMSGASAKKIVCTLSNVYKGWLEFRDRGELVGSNVYGDNGTVVLTNKGQNAGNQHHADPIGSVTIRDIRERAPKATASCYYEVDNTAIK